MAEREFKPMGVGDILDLGVRLYRSNFGRFLGVAAVVYVPLALLAALVQGVVTARMQAALEVGPEAVAEVGPGLIVGGVLVGAAAGVVSFLGTLLVNAALIRTVSEAYLGRVVGIGETYGFVVRRLGTIIWASILTSVIVAVGFILLVVPGIIFMLWFAFVTQVVVVEGTNAVGALKRSRALASGNLGKIFILGLILWVAAVVVAGIFGWVSALIVQGPGAGAVVLRTLLDRTGTLLLQPFVSACWILLYYDLRIRKEGFDLEMMVRSLGLAPLEQQST